MISISVSFQPAFFPARDETSIICVHGSSRSHASTEALLLTSPRQQQQVLTASIANVPLDPDRDRDLYLYYWSDTPSVPLAVIATARVGVYDLMKNRTSTVPLLDSLGKHQTHGSGGITVGVINSSFKLPSAPLSPPPPLDQNEAKRYCTAVTDSFDKWRPS